MKKELLVARMSRGLSFRRVVLALGVCAAAFSLTAAAPAQAAPSPFVGTWINTDAATNHIVRIQINQGVHGLGLQVFGKCTPSPCDWGQTGMTLYGNSISDLNPKYATAAYAHGFATRSMTFQSIDASTMVVHTYTKFNDNSGRQNYHVREVFKKLIILLPPPVFTVPGP